MRFVQNTSWEKLAAHNYLLALHNRHAPIQSCQGPQVIAIAPTREGLTHLPFYLGRQVIGVKQRQTELKQDQAGKDDVGWRALAKGCRDELWRIAQHEFQVQDLTSPEHTRPNCFAHMAHGGAVPKQYLLRLTTSFTVQGNAAFAANAVLAIRCLERQQHITLPQTAGAAAAATAAAVSGNATSPQGVTRLQHSHLHA
eukprot:CAMPEP_0202351468 /NCGR_PEP_ID=MMETSP1126-20121109/8093_1 /ASSEMBLY_ACC=CAM_ASM_000457 /TAXON_ID=3047 /ORGANISM="Dunaliella tertiolecta, Strain CCMP1320" /LENGTH=197 /DNA_ID=CAMNT_0048943575 /DNA_START=729 /DNA_END=1319 /DNA_ORIENTATION=+